MGGGTPTALFATTRSQLWIWDRYGGVRGGRVLGDWAGLAGDQLDDGDVRVTTDVRNVFAEVVSRRLGNGDLGEVFPGLQHRPIGFA